jgi:radical SAM superfamily enzyme YgiQ (UPF0313 family)
MPDESMEHPEVDLVVRGEAEETLVEIVRALDRRRAARRYRELLAACDWAPSPG